MEKVWEVFEHLSEIVYVSDMDSYELEYMNRCALEAYGFHSPEEIKGKKCYEILQNCSRPCAFCTNRHLRPGHFYEWKYNNPLVGKPFSLKDTMFEKNGKRYRMEIAVDMNIQEMQRQTIDTLMNNEAMINEGLRIALEERNYTRAIEVFLEYLGQNLKSERIYIFEEQKGEYVKNTFEWCADGVTAQKDNLQEVPLEVVQIWYDFFEQQKNIIISDLENIKEEAPLLYEYLKPQDIYSMVVSPLVVGGEIIGFYGVDNPPGEMLEHISEMFWIVGHFIVSLLKKRDLIVHLEELCYYDQLTGVQNRHAMHEFIASFGQARNVGIIYCDVMGLKRVNDTLGHREGDKLLLRAGQCLKNRFRITDLYRIGGDEFLVLCNNIDEKEFYGRVEELRICMQKNNALMALGCLWEADTSDIEALIARADNLMYEEKQAYYAAKDSS